MNARQKAKKYKKELDILKQAPIPRPKVFYGVSDVVTYKAEERVSIDDILEPGYSDDVITNILIDKFREAIKDNMKFDVEDCRYGKRILAWIRLVKPRRAEQ